MEQKITTSDQEVRKKVIPGERMSVISPFRYFGGKSRASVVEKLKKYAPPGFFEDKDWSYLEPMCGGSGLFFSIPTYSVQSRWINDKDENLMAVYLALRDRPKEFIQSCRNIEPIKSIDDLDGIKRLKTTFHQFSQDGTMDPALKYFFMNRVNWGGRINDQIASQVYFSNPQGWNIVKTDILEKAAEHLQGVKITARDYNALLNKPGKSREKVFVFLDPPYTTSKRLSKERQLYRHNFFTKQHKRLAKNVKLCQHKVMISYDDDPFIRELYQGFNIFEEEWTYCGNSGEEKHLGKELIITNYDVSSDNLF